jgi:hypothetical protein
MPQQGINFDGFFIPLPGAYYADNVSAAGPNKPPVTPPLLFIGYGWGPKPKTPITFTNPQDLINALRGGPAAAFVPFMVNPSPVMFGAQYITFIDASTNTQAALSLTNSSGSGVVSMTSVAYGPPSNQMQARVGAGSVSGVKVTLFDNYSNTTLVGDDLGFPFEVAYLGAASGVTYTIALGSTTGMFSLNSPTSGQSTSFVLGSGGYSTVSQLVEAINGTSYFAAQLLSATNGQLATMSLMASGAPGPGLPPLTSGGSEVWVAVASPVNDVVYWLNQYAGSLVTAVVPSGVSNTIANLPAGPTAFTPFSGAQGVPPTNNDYATALNIGLTTPAWCVFCDSNAQTVQSLLAQHCETASTPPYGMWRRGFTGSSLGDSVSTTEANAFALDSYTMAYLYPGVYWSQTLNGVSGLFSGLYAAAAAAGMASANQIAQPLTNKPLNATGVEQPGGATLTQSQLSALQNAGVMCIWQNSQTNGNLPTILSDVTTWQADANKANTSSQQVACRFWTAYSVVAALMPWVGSIASVPTESLILQAVIKALNALIFTGGSSNGVLASWDQQSLQLVYSGSTFVAAITFKATLVGQNEYITCYVPIEALNISISASSVSSA